MWILRAAICAAVPLLVAAQCENTTTTKPPPFLSEDNRGVEVWSEVSGSQIRKAYVVREVYDKASKRSLLEFYDGKAFERLLYDRSTKSLYSYTDSLCKVLKGNGIADVYKQFEPLSLVELTDLPNEDFLGPASLFDGFALSYKQLLGITRCNETFDRDIPCVKYTECINDGLQLWYSEPGYDIFNQKQSRPLRALLPSGVTVNILDIKTYANNEVLELFLPTGLSCDSPMQQEPRVPFDTFRRAFEAEVVFTSEQTSNVYVSQLSGIIVPQRTAENGVNGNDGDSDDGDDFSGLYSFTLSGFFRDVNATDFVPGNRRRIIHDVERGVVYDHVIGKDEFTSGLEKTTCRIYADTDFRAQIDLPFYGSIDLKPLFVQPPSAGSNAFITHLGINRVRFVETEVYEVTYPLYDTGTQKLSRLVVTYHFGINALGIQAIQLTGYTDKKAFEATIHVTRFDERIVQLNDKLRVDDCYDYIDRAELRWFQIGFETNTPTQLAQISKSAFNIRESFINKLVTDYRVEPMRIPQVNVDIVSSQVLISTLLLERPLLEAAFLAPLKKDFREVTRTLGIMSQRACLITCLGMGNRNCTAVSYCGGTCSVSNKHIPAAPINTVDSEECRLFERGEDRAISTSAQILRTLESHATTRVPENRLKMTVAFWEAGEKRVDLFATSFDDTKNFDNVFHFDKDKVAIIETSFNLANARKKYSSQANAKRLGSLALEDCALACKNRQDCETFSYCQNSRECTISANHDVQTAEIEDDNQCIIYQTKYVERFDQFPGLTVQAPGIAMKTTNVDSCAQKCVARSDCKSFEYCDSSGDCVLLKTHVTEASAIGSSNQELKCNHYSKKYLYDYTAVAGRIGTGDEKTILGEYLDISPAACAKLCSEWAAETTVCLSFDFCSPAADNTGLCVLRTVDGQGEQNNSRTCNFFYATSPPQRNVTRHRAGAAFGLSVLMILVGVGVSIGALYGCGRFR